LAPSGFNARWDTLAEVWRLLGDYAQDRCEIPSGATKYMLGYNKNIRN